MALKLHRFPAQRCLRLRLHGRTSAFKNAPTEIAAAREAAVRQSRCRLHRRAEPLRGQARPASLHLCVSEQHRHRALPSGAPTRKIPVIRDDSASPGGLFRRHRRTPRRRPAGANRRRDARRPVRHDRPGGQDRSRHATRPARTFIGSAKRAMPTSRIYGGLGTPAGCRSRSMRQPAISARRRHRNSWPRGACCLDRDR